MHCPASIQEASTSWSGAGCPPGLPVGIDDVVRHAIDACRPAGESWRVTIREVADGVIAVDLARGWEARESFTFGVDGDDAAHTGLIATTCRFLRRRWPDSFTPS
jgi:hypothetical protein